MSHETKIVHGKPLGDSKRWSAQCSCGRRSDSWLDCDDARANLEDMHPPGVLLSDPRDAEIAALRGRVAELEADAKIGRVVREFDAEARDILGRPCFTCGRIAEVLRRMGRTIPPKAEDEQAEVLRWMLGLYAEHGAQWREKGDDELRAALAATEVPRG